MFSFKLQGRLCTVFASYLLHFFLFDYFLFVVVVVNVESCMRKHGKSGNGIFCLFLLLLGWAIACVLRWDTCCDCSCFVCQRYLKLTGLLLGERFLRWRGTSLSRTSPPRASTKYCFCFFSCCWFSNQNEMCRRTEPRTTTCRAGVTCFFPGTLPQTKSCCRSPADGPGYSAAGGSARVCSLHRHVAVGVVHERRRVQGGCHVLVAEL